MPNYQSFSGELYVGQNIGEEILVDMYSAKENIKVVSPYITKDVFDKLKNKEIAISIITNSGNNIDKDLIGEKRIENFEGINKYRNYNKWIENIQKLGIFSSVILCFLIYVNIWYFFYILIPILLTACVITILKNLRNKIQEYSYQYIKNFDFMFADVGVYKIHSKIYIIDDKRAYVCSGNFTASGMKYNFETSIRITDRDAVQYLISNFKKHYQYLSNQQDLKVKEIGDTIYGKIKKINDTTLVYYE